MRNKTVTIEFTGELLYLGQTLSKSGPKAASAVMRRMSERQNWFTPLPCADVPDWFLIDHHKSMSPLLSSYRSSSGWSLLRITALAFLATYVLLELFELGFYFPPCPVIFDNLYD